MATWAALTQEQKDTYLSFENDLRAFCGQFQRLCNGAVALNTRYNAQIQSIIDTLDANVIVPKSTGLSGADSLDCDADTATLVSHLQSLLTTLNTTGHQEKRAKSCGSANAGV